MAKSFWKIEGYDGEKKTFERVVRFMTEAEMSLILSAWHVVI